MAIKTGTYQRSKTGRHKDLILQQYAAGKSLPEIAKHVGCHRDTIGRFLDKISQEKQQIEQFRTHRADVLSTIQAKSFDLQLAIIEQLRADGLLASLSPSQKAGILHSLVVVSGTAYDKERLETGKSTNNFSLVSQLVQRTVKKAYQDKKPTEKPLEVDGPASQPVDVIPDQIMQK